MENSQNNKEPEINKEMEAYLNRSKSNETVDKLPIPKGEVNIKCYIDGKLAWDETTSNLVVQWGRSMICNCLAGNLMDIQEVGVGTNPTTPAITDTALTGPPFIKNINQGLITFPTLSSMVIPFTILSSEANGMTIQEMGLHDGSGNLFSRMTRGAIVKTSAMSLVCTWTLSF